MSGPVTVVTGGGRGIGRAIAWQLLEEGQRVAVFEIEEGLLDDLASARGDDPNLSCVPCDVTDEERVQAAFQSVLTRWGRLDGLVNNAANPRPYSGPIEELSLAAWRRILSVNLDSVFLCSKHAAPALRRHKGAIVNIASVRALQSEPHGEAYAASKGAILSLTHALAMSLGPDVRVNAVSPGRISTVAWQKTAESRPHEPGQRDAEVPLGRVGTPEDIAHLVSFLLSSKARFVTGQNFVADGGVGKKIFFP